MFAGLNIEWWWGISVGKEEWSKIYCLRCVLLCGVRVNGVAVETERKSSL